MTNKHYCDKEAEISEIHTMVKDMHHLLKGNGQPGLMSEFQQWKGAIKFAGFIMSLGIVSSLIVAVIL